MCHFFTVSRRYRSEVVGEAALMASANGRVGTMGKRLIVPGISNIEGKQRMFHEILMKSPGNEEAEGVVERELDGAVAADLAQNR